jgi:hypothetical protein
MTPRDSVRDDMHAAMLLTLEATIQPRLCTNGEAQLNTMARLSLIQWRCDLHAY